MKDTEKRWVTRLRRVLKAQPPETILLACRDGGLILFREIDGPRGKETPEQLASLLEGHVGQLAD